MVTYLKNLVPIKIFNIVKKSVNIFKHTKEMVFKIKYNKIDSTSQ